jgi:MFS family permease
MSPLAIVRSLDADQRRAFIASFLGWTLDAFDFFLVTFIISKIAGDFSMKVVDVGLAITLTLVMRPVGALIFGVLADRFGRRAPLMGSVAFYSLMELLTAFSPNFQARRWRSSRCRPRRAALRRASCSKATRRAICSRRWRTSSSSRHWAGAGCS